jgi:hypothetical protein
MAARPVSRATFSEGPPEPQHQYHSDVTSLEHVFEPMSTAARAPREHLCRKYRTIHRRRWPPQPGMSHRFPPPPGTGRSPCRTTSGHVTAPTRSRPATTTVGGHRRQARDLHRPEMGRPMAGDGLTGPRRLITWYPHREAPAVAPGQHVKPGRSSVTAVGPILAAECDCRADPRQPPLPRGRRRTGVPDGVLLPSLRSDVQPRLTSERSQPSHVVRHHRRHRAQDGRRCGRTPPARFPLLQFRPAH